jgi:LuxR family transcriptional regulator, quorum-sensing system regulator SdiA
MNFQTARVQSGNPFEGLTKVDDIWSRLVAIVNERFGITSVLFAFTHSRFTTSRVGVTSSLFLMQNLPEDFLNSFPHGLSLDDDIAAELILSGESEFLWSSFEGRVLRPEQRARYEADKAMGMGVGVSFGFRFGGTSGFGGMCWGKRYADADEFEAIWLKHRAEMVALAHQFEAIMRPAMVWQRFSLTPREVDVMSFSAGGMTQKQIAEHLHLSPKTIANTLDRTRKKLDAVSTMEAVAKALIYELIG